MKANKYITHKSEYRSEKQTEIKDNSRQKMEKAIFGELYQVRKINNLVHKLTFSIQRNKELITDHYPQLEWELRYLQKELERIKTEQNRLSEEKNNVK